MVDKVGHALACLPQGCGPFGLWSWVFLYRDPSLGWSISILLLAACIRRDWNRRRSLSFRRLVLWADHEYSASICFKSNFASSRPPVRSTACPLLALTAKPARSTPASPL